MADKPKPRPRRPPVVGVVPVTVDPLAKLIEQCEREATGPCREWFRAMREAGDDQAGSAAGPNAPREKK